MSGYHIAILVIIGFCILSLFAIFWQNSNHSEYKEIDQYNLQYQLYQPRTFTSAPEPIFPKDSTITPYAYAQYYQEAQESEIYSRAQEADAFHIRFAWIPAFYTPRFFRIDKKEEQYKMEITEFTGPSEHLRGEAKKKTVDISENDIKELQRLIDSSPFWSIVKPAEVLGCDGAEWVIEVVENGKYQAVNRWNGYRLEKIGEFIFKL